MGICANTQVFLKDKCIKSEICMKMRLLTNNIIQSPLTIVKRIRNLKLKTIEVLCNVTHTAINAGVLLF